MANIKKETKTFYISGYNEQESSFASSTDVSTFSKFIEKPLTNNNYGIVKMNMATYAETMLYVTFDISAIPKNAIIKSVTAKIKASTTGSGTYIQYRQARALNDAGWLSSSTTLSSSPDSYTISLYSRDWTVEMLESFMLRFYVKRNSRSTSYSYQMQIYAAELTIEYEYEEDSNNLFIKSNGKWKAVSKVMKKINGNWQEIEANDLPRDKVYKRVNIIS